MQGTTDFPEPIAEARFPEAAGIMDDAAAFDAAVDVLDAHAPAGDAPIRGFLRAREGPAPRLLGRHDHFDLRERKRQKAQILEPPAARGQRVGAGISHALIVDTARRGPTQKENRERGVDPPHVFDRVARFLAAITARLLSRILGALEAPFGAIVPTRGEGGAGTDTAVGRSDGGGDTAAPSIMAAASASATPRRVANSVKDRVGASPRPRSAARRTTKRTCLH
jgi:hypothetical protein